MATVAEAAQAIGSFPSQQHVADVCRPNQDALTCKYLDANATRYLCMKASSQRQEIDDDPETFGTSDNCPGILGFVIANQKPLIGNATTKVRPSKEFSGQADESNGVFEGVSIVDGNVQTGGLSISEDQTEVTIIPFGIVFSKRKAPEIGDKGWDDVGESETVLYIKPGETF
jgi:hypothetical protein